MSGHHDVFGGLGVAFETGAGDILTFDSLRVNSLEPGIDQIGMGHMHGVFRETGPGVIPGRGSFGPEDNHWHEHHRQDADQAQNPIGFTFCHCILLEDCGRGDSSGSAITFICEFVLLKFTFYALYGSPLLSVNLFHQVGAVGDPVA